MLSCLVFDVPYICNHVPVHVHVCVRVILRIVKAGCHPVTIAHVVEH